MWHHTDRWPVYHEEQYGQMNMGSDFPGQSHESHDPYLVVSDEWGYNSYHEFGNPPVYQAPDHPYYQPYEQPYEDMTLGEIVNSNAFNTLQSNPHPNNYNEGWFQHQDFSWTDSYDEMEPPPCLQHQFQPPPPKSSLEDMIAEFIAKTEQSMARSKPTPGWWESQPQSPQDPLEATSENLEHQVCQLVNMHEESPQGSSMYIDYIDHKEQVDDVTPRDNEETFYDKIEEDSTCIQEEAIDSLVEENLQEYTLACHLELCTKAYQDLNFTNSVVCGAEPPIVSEESSQAAFALSIPNQAALLNKAERLATEHEGWMRAEVSAALPDAKTEKKLQKILPYNLPRMKEIPAYIRCAFMGDSYENVRLFKERAAIVPLGHVTSLA